MPFDANKLYCSEILAILLQNNDGESESFNLDHVRGTDGCQYFFSRFSNCVEYCLRLLLLILFVCFL